MWLYFQKYIFIFDKMFICVRNEFTRKCALFVCETNLQ